MQKNAQIHLVLETFRLEKLKQLAREENISLNNYCLSRIYTRPQLTIIEEKLNKLLNKNGIK
ncbi:hypothetical protein KAS08_02350 [Candidatus Pacearchaeota archaeon]|nr:hypothetical protein [Candidatus Pacearchaeota archaeon]